MSARDAKQSLYDRIRSSSKHEVIVEEMIRHGFWTRGGPNNDFPKDDFDRMHELGREVSELSKLTHLLEDPEKAKVELRRRRMLEARQKREETKRRREEARQARAAAWAARKQTEIGYLGAGVSGALGQQAGQVPAGLPDVSSAPAIAEQIGISVGELRWLAFHRSVSQTTHYRRFQIPKKTGGTRLISAPMPRLKRAQRWVLEAVLGAVPVHEAAHGFVPGRSIVTNAAQHVGRKVVINLDLQGFFPTLGYPRVYGLFASLGYSPEASTVLALLCTEPEVDEVELDGKRWYVHASERRLPQGSPASPAITNLICRRLDRRMAGLAAHLGFTYTRYADDLTFSSGAEDANVGRLLKAVRDIVTDEGFVVHPDKTRVMRTGRRQEVTGLVVNERVAVPRELLKSWRATVFQVRRDGPEGKRFGVGPDVFASLTGFAAFVRMVDPERGGKMLAEVRELARAHGWSAPRRRTYAPAAAPVAAPAVPAAEASPPRARWWEFWKWLRWW